MRNVIVNNMKLILHSFSHAPLTHLLVAQCKQHSPLNGKKNTRQVDLRHMDGRPGSNAIDVGMDLSEFYKSVEWDILDVPAVR